jgi:hypothetical protein
MRAAPILTADDPTSLILRAIATHECGKFTRRRLRVRNSRTVHDVQLMPWIGGLQLPRPACHQPTGSPALVGELVAVDDAVTCRRCLAFSPEARTAPHAGYGQLSLVF